MIVSMSGIISVAIEEGEPVTARHAGQKRQCGRTLQPCR